MRRTAWILALILLPTGSHGAIVDANQRGINELIDSAQLWQARRRPDLARSLLQKVLAVRADEPRALLLLGEIDLRSGRKDAALSQLAILQARHPDSTELRELQLLASLYNNDSLRLSRLQQLRETGRTAEAAALARQIFPSARPPGLLGADLAGLIASTPGAWDISRRQAEERVAASSSAVNRLALAEVLALRPNTSARAWETYNLLAREAQLPAETVAGSWRRSIRLQPEGTSVGPLWAALNKAIDGPGPATVMTVGTRPNGALNGTALTTAINAMNAGGIDAPAAGALAAARLSVAQATASPAVPAPAPSPASPPQSARDKAIRQVLEEAQVLLAAGSNEQAAKRLEISLVRHGDDGPTWGLLGLSRMREGQHAEAEPAFARALRLDPADAQRWRSLGLAAHYWATVSLARIEADVGRTEEAADLLRPVIDSQPKAIEAKLLLARLEGEMGQHEAALGHFEQVLSLEPEEERAWRGRFNVRLITDPEAAITEVAAFGPVAAEILDSGAVRDLADVRLAQGSTSAALRLLEQAIAVAPAEPWLRHDAARIYQQLGLPESARTLMADGRTAASADATVTMQQASALVALAGDENDLAVELVSALPEAEANGPLRPLVQRAQLEQAFSNARQAIDAQRPSNAHAWLDKADRLIDSSAAQGMRLARLRLGASQRPQALTLLRRIDPVELDAADTLTWAGMVVDAGDSNLALDRLQERIDANTQAHLGNRTPKPDAANSDVNTEISADVPLALPIWSPTELNRARLAHAELAIEAGLPQAARLDLQTLASSLPADALDERLRLLSLQRRVGETAGARATLADLLLRSGDEPAVRIAAARQARSDDDDVGALGHLQVARERSAPGSDSATEADRARDSIDAVRQPLLEVALHDASLNGSEGRAHLQSSEATARLSWPGLGNGTLFTQIDLIRLDAGTLPAALAQSEAFGRVLAQNPAGLAAPSAQNDRGAAFGVGWSSRNEDVDIGVVSLRLRNVVGGWSHTRRRDDGGWNIEVSRRVLTSSLLSWAGARDPSDGSVWGGVTLNALTLRAEHVLSEADSAALSLRVGVLQGREVASNQMLQLRGALDHDLQSSADHRLRIGLNGNLWHYARNLSFHTFGQGGYYSPQRYLSIGVPLEVAGLNGPMSYQVRASLSHSWTREDDTPYYPTDPAAQAAAGNPIHTGGPGGGVGASLRAALEWRIAPQWALGGALALERSTDYTPARASLYLRHWLGRVPAPLDWPPQPLTPYLRN